MLVCKGPYVILQGNPLIEKTSNTTFDISLKGDIKMLIFSEENRGKPQYTHQRKKFSRANCFSGDKGGAHTSSADQT